MTRHQPLWQQAGEYPAARDRQLMASVWPSGGGAGGRPTKVNNTMDQSIPPGWLAVPLQGHGTVVCQWDEAEVITHTAAPPTGQQRWDIVVCQVHDPDIDGGTVGDFTFDLITGVPATSSPVIPTVPPNAVQMTWLLVNGGQANLNTANYYDKRPLGYAVVRHLGGAQTLPNTAYGQVWYDTVDSGSCFSFHAFSVPFPGRYRVQGAFSLDRAVSFTGAAIVKQGGVHLKRTPNNNQVSTGYSTAPGAAIDAVVIAAKDDALSIWGLVGPAANTQPNLAGPGVTQYASFEYIGPA